MSWDQQSYSFGNPNAQPPTPSQTPTSAQFPSPTFQTPRNSWNFENRSGWTPTFAEEYSVFNSTPGRLTNTAFAESSNPQLSANSTQILHLPSTGDIAAELATHVHHLSPNPGLPLPPVQPSVQLCSTTSLYSDTRTRFDDSAKRKATPTKTKEHLDETFSGQTATPPQSASKRTRKLAPKALTETMQDESHQSLYGVSATPTHDPNLMSFPPSSTDLFPYPMSAPATAESFAKPFWDTDSSMVGMGLEFSADDPGMFNTGSHRISTSFDWGRTNQLFQDTVNVPSDQNHEQTPKRQRPLAPKTTMANTQIAASLPPFDFSTVPVSDDPFSVAHLDGAVDPGLLFSRHNSVSMASAFEDTLPPARPAASQVVREPYQHQLRELRQDLEEHRRSRGTRDSGYRIDRRIVSSPVKGSARPMLQRSISDTRGKRTQDRVLSRARRLSPVKHQRPTSLTTISESPISKPRTEVKFSIDANGRARTETVVVGKTRRKSHERQSSGVQEQWDSSQYESSSDEEPIIVPSRNSSFSLPTQSNGPKLARFDTSNRGVDPRKQSTSPRGYSKSESSSQQSLYLDGVESEAETLMEDGQASGDATRELRKVVESRKKQQMRLRDPRHHRYSSDITPKGGLQYANYSSSSNISPTTVTDPDGATPSSSRSGVTRCVCNSADSDGFMILCESCEHWLHAQCVGIDRRSLPPVYICAFCAQTPPNLRGARIREAARGSNRLSSPLAHKIKPLR